MHIVVVESPAKCKTIKKYLGNDYKVLASYGHIRDLPSRDGSVKPDNDFEMDYEISSGSERHVKAIVDALKGADSLILATDPDREGEAISWHILEVLKEKNALTENLEVKRVSFNSITQKAVLDAIENSRLVDMSLVEAQQARRALDYLVGFNLSPVLWRKLPGSKSAGRVQSVALRLICEREDEIERFVSREYWDIETALTNSKNQHFTATLSQLGGEKLDKFALTNESEAFAVAAELRKRSFKVGSIERKQTRRNPYAPFTTSTLQQEASRKLGFSASRTMQVAQELYEGVDLGGETTGLITYMRTDGVTVVPEAIEATRSLVREKFGANFVPEKPRHYATKAKNAQEAHEAIRPTDPKRTPESVAAHVSKDQLRLYELVWKRLLASQMESAVFDQVGVDIVATDGYATLRASGSTLVFEGFLRLYREDSDDEKPADDENDRTLPPLNDNEALGLGEVKPAQHFTEPPARFSEASLVKRMEELGIGRPSTYASIISILQDRGYVKLDKKRFHPEDRGRLVTAFLHSFFSRYVEYDFTANLEDKLDDISAGKLDWKEVLSEFWHDFSGNVDDATKLSTTEVLSTLNTALEQLVFPGTGSLEERRKCPKCNEGELSLKTSRYGPFVGCSRYPECKFTRPIAANDGGEGGALESGEPVVLGVYPETKEDISLRKGPYGMYLQVGEGSEDKKPRRVALPKGVNARELDLTKALALLSLPREVGNHPETGKMIKAGIGRFGPYLYHDAKYVSLKGDDDVLTVGINRAVVLFAEAATKQGATALKVLGAHPEGGEVAVFEGRYGPYVKHGSINATLPKGTTADNITMEAALELLAAKAKKGGGKKGGKKAPAKEAKAKKEPKAKKDAAEKPAKKAAPKKAAAKKAPAKKAS